MIGILAGKRPQGAQRLGDDETRRLIESAYGEGFARSCELSRQTLEKFLRTCIGLYGSEGLLAKALQALAREMESAWETRPEAPSAEQPDEGAQDYGG